MSSKEQLKARGTSRSFAAAAPELSVLLPTYNRAAALQRTLAALEAQTAAASCYEIIVVDDGSSDNTVQLLQHFAEKTTAPLCWVSLAKNSGPARARNAGLALVRGKAVLILGDDIEPAALLLQKHLQFHQERPDERDALLGYVSFPEELPPSLFMRWLEQAGRRYFFNYAALQAGQEAGPMFFYTCNVSVKRALLDKSGWFDESFPYASHEDLELGCRLAQQGMRLLYDPSAQGFHWHLLTVQGIAKRIYLMGYSAKLFWHKVPPQESLSKQAIRRVLTLLCATPLAVQLWNWLRNREYAPNKTASVAWHLLLFLSFFLGLADACAQRSIRVLSASV
ncbi:glycosyltransferase family 2 protein [Candidatus Electronema sp. PJ]|uniref:glycosyltransferase family 2 protein n=1 Tax=Candidatus Electronema sp. PJ TaxID=3401572 RepID=UPI003AA7D957